jgi:hypothetical protein
MVAKSLIAPEKKRILAPPFAWIDRQFFFSGFMTELGAAENLLYFFLVLIADKDGLSWYGYDKICATLHITLDEYITARETLIRRNLIAFRDGLFQVLVLPTAPGVSKNSDLTRRSQSGGVRSLRDILQNL